MGGVRGNPGMVGVVRWMVAIHHRLVLLFVMRARSIHLLQGMTGLSWVGFAVLHDIHCWL